MEDRRAKYTNTSRKSKDENLKINVNFDITQLDLLCAYIVSENKYIRRGNVSNLKTLLGILDMSIYNNDQERLNRLNFISKGIHARLDLNLTNSQMILQEINGGIGTTNTLSFPELTKDEVSWVNNSISEILKYADIYKETDVALGLITKFKSTDFDQRADIVEEISNWISNMQNKFRKQKADFAEDMTFSLMGDSYIDAMNDTYTQITSPSNKLIFGTQALNIITGGGLESGRVYVLLGLPGEGKSSTLLDMAIEIKKYNNNYICKDPTKRPCVVLFVMENSIKETVQRLFSMCVGTGMENFTRDEICDVLQTQGKLKVTDDSPIDIIIKYKPNLSVDTSYLYTIADDLEDEGYEVICLIQDYLKRIRSVEGSFSGDLRLQLGAVVNEFKVFATLKNIPVVTASQLNRNATSSVDDARVKNKSDLVRLIGRSNVGESNLILENADWIALIAPELDLRENIRYLGIQRVKSRYYISNEITTVFIPYINDTIKFVEDLNSLTPVHRTTMRQEIQLNNGMSIGPQPIQGSINAVVNIDDGTTMTAPEENIFSGSIEISAARRLDLNIAFKILQQQKPLKLMYEVVDKNK